MPRLERFLNIWKFIYSYVQDIESSVSSSICAICDSLMLCKVHYFGKRWIFNKLFQVGACPNLKDSSLYDRFSIHMYKAWSVRFLWLFFALSATLLCLVRYIVWKKMIPQYMNCFLFICTRHRVQYLQLFFRYLRLPNALQGTLFWKKIFSSWNISSWCMPQLERFLNIWKFF